MKGTIALIIPYFGALPEWFPYFVESVSHSPILDVLLFTDARVGTELPANVKVHSCSLTEFDALASRALSIPVSLKAPFKICDFKPAFGEIFQEHIREYGFWAFGDLDLIYGDVESFLVPLLQDHDVISCRKEWISGSLCILRNCKEVNSLYTRSPDWKRAFLASDYKMFDEMGGFFFAEVLRGADINSLKGEVESFTHVVKTAGKQGTLRCAFIDLACEDIDWGQSIVYDAGQLTRSTDGSAVMYVHFVCMKRRFFEVPSVAPAQDKFYIRKTGIYQGLPDARVIFTNEPGRVLRGSMRGSRRLLRRLIG